jgi:hypothetical protein
MILLGVDMALSADELAWEEAEPVMPDLCEGILSEPSLLVMVWRRHRVSSLDIVCILSLGLPTVLCVYVSTPPCSPLHSACAVGQEGEDNCQQRVL